MPDRDGTHTNSHSGLHGEQGALPGEHPGRARNPLVKVHVLAWLEFTKPDLARAEAFAHAFGFTTALLTDRAASARHRPGRTVCARPPGRRVCVRRPGVPRRRRRRRR